MADRYPWCTARQYRDFRKIVISMVLATDLTEHFNYITRLNAMRPGSLVPAEAWADDTPTGGGADATEDNRLEVLNLALDVMIKFADLGHAIKPWEQHERWSKWVVAEFYLLGDRERENGWEISPLCDREKDSDLARNQVGCSPSTALTLWCPTPLTYPPPV